MAQGTDTHAGPRWKSMRVRGAAAGRLVLLGGNPCVSEEQPPAGWCSSVEIHACPRSSRRQAGAPRWKSMRVRGAAAARLVLLGGNTVGVAVRPIRIVGDPVLHTPTRPVIEF